MKSIIAIIVIIINIIITINAQQQLNIYAINTLNTRYAAQFETFAGLPSGTVKVYTFVDNELDKVILQPNLNPIPDVVLGVDNIHEFDLTKGVFRSAMPANLQFVNKNLANRVAPFNLFPYEYGRITVIANTTRIGGKYDATSLNLVSLANSPEILKKLIVQDPSIDVTGAAFLLATVAAFGDADAGIVGAIQGQGDWRAWWKKVLPYVTVSSGWSDSWERFAVNQTFEMLVSYELDQAYYVCTSNETDVIAIPLEGDLWYLIESLGIHNRSQNPTLALQFVDWYLSHDVQTTFPNTHWMYPSRENITMPPCFEGQYVNPDPTFNERINITTLIKNIPKWYQEWRELYSPSKPTSPASVTLPCALVALVMLLLQLIL